MAYRLTGEEKYLDTIVNAYDFLRETQLFATGGYGPEESLIVPAVNNPLMYKCHRERPIGGRTHSKPLIGTAGKAFLAGVYDDEFCTTF